MKINWKDKKQVKKYKREYYQRPEVKKHRREYQKEYKQRPEVKKHIREYNQRPEVKKHQREYKQRPEVKKHQREYKQKRELEFVKIPTIKGIEKIYADGKAKEIQKQVPEMMNKIALKLLEGK